MAGSVVLHGALLAAFAFVSLPEETMPQQMVEVLLVASPPSPITAPKPPQVARTSPKIPAPSRDLAKNAASQALQQEVSAPAKEVNTAAEDGNAKTTISNTSAVSAATISAPVFDAAYLRNPAPQYPARAKQRGMEGTVMLSVLVLASGKASEVRVASSSGHVLLDTAAMRAVERWRFVPAKRQGSAVDAEVIVPVEYRLE